MPAPLLPWIKPQFSDAEGEPVAGGRLYSFVAGLSPDSPQATYSDVDLEVPNTNPIVLDLAGQSATSIYLTPNTGYKFRLDTELGVPLWTVDNVWVFGPEEEEAEETGDPSQDWQDIAFDAANFVSAGGGTFNPTVTTNRWRYVGDNAVFWIFTATAMGLSGTLGAALRVRNLPFTLVPTAEQLWTMDGATNPGPNLVGTTSFAPNAVDLLTIGGGDWTDTYTANAMSWVTTWQVVPPA